MPSHLSTRIADGNLSLAFEAENDDDDDDNGHSKEKEDSNNIMASTLAVYSNNQSIPLSYISIFEKLWIQNERYMYNNKR